MVRAGALRGRSRARATACGLGLALLTGGAGRCGAVVPAAIALPGCTPPAGLSAELVEPADLAARCGGDGACWRAGLETARAVRDRFPDAYDAHRAYVLVARAAARWLGPGVAKEVAGEYEELARSHPGHPAYPHLLAQLTLDGAAYRDRLEALSREFPDYPWVALSLAFQVRPDAPAEQRSAASSARERFAALCPDRIVERERALELAGDGEAVLAQEADLRARALARADAGTLARLWALVLRAVPVERREPLREPVAAGVAALERSPAAATPAGLRARILGAEIAGDRAARARAEDALLAGFPCSDDAARVRAERWRESHRDPGGTGAAAQAEWRRSFLADLEQTLAACPDDEPALRRKLELLEGAPEVDGRDLLATAGRLLDLPHRRSSGVPSDPGWVATICLDRGLGLERVPALLEADRAEARAAHERESRAGDDAADARFAWRQRENLRLSARLALATSRIADARTALDALAAATAAAPGGGRSPAVAELASFPDERTALDLLTARLALADGRPQDALALLARLLPDELLGPVVEADARAAWRAARGSGDGFDAWRGALAAGRPPTAWRTVDRPLPGATLTEFGSGAWRWADRAGKTVVVTVWATWCAPCRDGLAWVARLAERLAARDDVAVVALDADRTNAALLPFLADHSIDLPMLVGGDALYDEGLAGVPTTWIVSPAGRIVRELEGFAGPAEAWLDSAQREVEAVAGPPPAPGP